MTIVVATIFKYFIVKLEKFPIFFFKKFILHQVFIIINNVNCKFVLNCQV